MPERIQILSPDIADRIAAGEVVERPASIVKELVENAIDAEAREVCVDVADGGLTAIRVADDGIGMTAAELRLAVQRHATSKIRVAEDLAAIRTLGFRGEALPSIAAIARVTIATKPRGGEAAEGSRLAIEGGVVRAQGVAGCAEGTEVVVRDLFFNTPARKKFLKGERTEFGYLHETVLKLALAYPAIRIRLTHNDRVVLMAPHAPDLFTRIATCFDARRVEQLVPCTFASGTLRGDGFIGRPELAGPSQQGYCFVNGRPVRDRVLLHAVAEGYRTYVPKGSYPFVVLHLTIDPAEVDVNVHPAKAEVRFANPGGVHHAIATAVRKCLAAPASELHTISQTSAYPPFRAPEPSAVRESLDLLRPVSDTPLPDLPTVRSGPITPGVSSRTSFRPLGQLAATYLVYEGPGGMLLLIDQHAAHERIGFERLRHALAAGGIPRQALLTPLVVELGPAEAAAVAQAEDLLARAGLEIRPVGGTSVAVQAVPALLADSDIVALVRAVAAELVAYGATSAIDDAVDRLLATVACHRQVRAGDRLAEEELASLVGELTEGIAKERCPHGRPTWVSFPAEAIAKWFKRS